MQGCTGNGDNDRGRDHREDLGLRPRDGQQQILRHSLDESAVHTVARKTSRRKRRRRRKKRVATRQVRKMLERSAAAVIFHLP